MASAMSGGPMVVYALFDGPRYVCAGTQRQIAQACGVSPREVARWASPVTQRAHEDHGMACFALGTTVRPHWHMDKSESGMRDRDMWVYEMHRSGYSDFYIAQNLGVSRQTVKNSIARVEGGRYGKEVGL